MRIALITIVFLAASLTREPSAGVIRGTTTSMIGSIKPAHLFAQANTSGAVEIMAEPHHRLVLENEYVRVFSVEVPPHGATLMHRHWHDYIFVTLGASDVESDVAGKQPVKLKLQDGETRFAPGNFEHIAKDLADTPFRNVTIEFLKDAKAKEKPPPKWNEERGVTAYEGGTRDILFVKDGARVSEVNLQPGAVVPKHHHLGPHLLVAVSDLDLQSNGQESGPASVQMKAGEVKWIAAGLTHSVTNAGKQKARLITVEFQ
jgi:quercetin dioxygenase-like cupin family protein